MYAVENKIDSDQLIERSEDVQGLIMFILKSLSDQVQVELFFEYLAKLENCYFEQKGEEKDGKSEDVHIDPLLLRPVSDLDLTTRSARALNTESICLIGDLVQHTQVSLLRLQPIGAKSLQNIEDALAARGLVLNAIVPNWPPENYNDLVVAAQN